MASHNFLLFLEFLLLATLLCGVSAYKDMEALSCSRVNKCYASLYHINSGIQVDQLASYYSVNSSQIKRLSRFGRQDYLITVPCSCSTINGTTGYFYDTLYPVNHGDTFVNVSDIIYNGQAWRLGGEENNFIAGENYTMHLLCGCVESKTESVVTYTVQTNDTLSDIAILLSSSVDGIRNLTSILHNNPGFVGVGWVLFAPTEKNGVPPPEREEKEESDPSPPA